MAQPKILNTQLNDPGKFDTGEYGWADLLAPLHGGVVTGSSDPDWNVFIGGIYAYSFPASGASREVWIAFHVPHTYAAGTVMYPHVHWSTPGTNTGVVRWGFEYTIAKGYSQQVFPTSTTVYLEQAASGTPRRHMIVESPSISIPATNLEPDSMILARIFRDSSHANDTCTDAAFGLQCDLHYQVAQFSTIGRNYPFNVPPA
jgi:hypothetical protein